MIQQNLEGEKKGQATFGNPDRKKKPKTFPEDKAIGLSRYEGVEIHAHSDKGETKTIRHGEP